MSIIILVNLLNSMSLAFLAIASTIFVFGVTLLGAAIERSRQEEKLARENQAEQIQKDIVKVEKSINEIKNGANSDIFKAELEKLFENKSETEKKIKQIKYKYNRINLRNTVVYPSMAFLLSLLLSFKASFSDGWSGYTFLGLEIFFMSFGVIRIYLSLSLIEEISANKKESEYFDHIKDAFKKSLSEYEQGKTEEAEIVFSEKKFPLNINPSTELKLIFYLTLLKGKQLTNPSVWFFVPDGLELIEPNEKDSWRQSSDFTFPNIRTVKVTTKNLNIGTKQPGSVTIKTPSNPGKFSITYQIIADGYSGEKKDIKLIVG